MAGLPANVSQGTVTGKIGLAVQVEGSDADIDVVAAVGSVTFSPSITQMLHAGSDLVIIPRPITVVLDANGAFTTKLIATDDPDLNPIGWTYHASFALEGVGVTEFNFSVPSGSTQDISDLIGSGG